MTKSEQRRLDAKLDHWAATDKQHRANLAEIERRYQLGLHKRSEDNFDLAAYKRMLRNFPGCV